MTIHMDDDVEDFAPSPPQTTTVPLKDNSTRPALDSPEKTFQTAKEEQTTRDLPNSAVDNASSEPIAPHSDHIDDGDVSPAQDSAASSPIQSPSSTTSPTKKTSEDAKSQSDASSPARPIVRKSSLNFASLPAREPLTAGKSLGGRKSRVSQIDSTRISYFNRPTGGKSLGNMARDDDEELDVTVAPKVVDTANVAEQHNKTYTQRLQDQISRLGNSQPSTGRQSQLGSSVATQLSSQTIPQSAALPPKSPTPTRKPPTQTTPGAFPEDEDEDEDDWIDPPPEVTETRPVLPKSHTADVMEDIHSKDTVGQSDFDGAWPLTAPARALSPRQQSAFAHGKSASVSALPLLNSAVALEMPALTKATTISNPAYDLSPGRPETPKSSRSFRDSPLKQVKNKLSSILKSSRSLLASSAALSAEGKSSIMSPSMTRLGFHAGPSLQSVAEGSDKRKSPERETSPSRLLGRRTRASSEREKEEKRQGKEAKRMEAQMGKLEKERQKESEKARVFSKEQERIAAMEKQVVSKKEQERLLPKETPKPTRTSPRKAKLPEKAAEQDVEMADATLTKAPASIARPTTAGGIARPKELKRPLKPSAQTSVRPRQAPTVIRVNMGTQQYQSAPGSSANVQETNVSSSSQSHDPVQSKASKAPLQTKPSIQSLKGASTASKSKASELAAKKREQEEREAQRKRDAKTEMDRKRAAAIEEKQRQEQQRRQDAEKHAAKEREQTAAQSEAKKNAQRQAAIEKAKQTRAPPPAVRPHPNGPPEVVVGQSGEAMPPRPPSRMTSNMPRSHDEPNRPVNSVLSNASKAGVKRAPPAETADEKASRSNAAYQSSQAKRRRTSEGHKDDFDAGRQSNIKGPPVRPSAGFKKVSRRVSATRDDHNLTKVQELPSKAAFPAGYSHVPQTGSSNIFKPSVAQQNPGQASSAHPMGMAQISKGGIPFAAGTAPSNFKTPARPGQYSGPKSVVKPLIKSSPKFENGENIDLPEIDTDEEDEEEETDRHGVAPEWAESPFLKDAIMRQETIDPMDIFGPPMPINMEEVFKSKERWQKFRLRTSSANWSGKDKLTEEDIRKDMAARDKLRREGGWSYQMGMDLA